MAKTAWIITFKLKNNVSNEDFIATTQKLHDEVISKAKGFISWQQYLQGDIWTDFVIWETLEDANNGTEVGNDTIEAKNFYDMLELDSCQMLISPLIKEY